MQSTGGRSAGCRVLREAMEDAERTTAAPDALIPAPDAGKPQAAPSRPAPLQLVPLLRISPASPPAGSFPSLLVLPRPGGRDGGAHVGCMCRSGRTCRLVPLPSRASSAAEKQKAGIEPHLQNLAAMTKQRQLARRPPHAL